MSGKLAEKIKSKQEMLSKVGVFVFAIITISVIVFIGVRAAKAREDRHKL